MFCLSKVSNFQGELLGDWFPQLSNNVSESLNAVLQNCYKRGFVNNSALAEGLHTFYSDRRDKYRIFVTGEKVNQRKKSDLIRFSKLKFIATQFFHLLQNPENAFYPGFYESCFFEAIFKFSRINENHINEMYLNMFSNNPYPPQITVPDF